VNDDGTVMRGPQVSGFAEAHNLQQVTVADLIAYRQRKETLIERIGEYEIDTCAGTAKAITYALPWEPMHHAAIVYGDIRDGEDVPVRLQREDVLSDVFGARNTLDSIMNRIAEEKRGVIVYLREGSVGVGRDDDRNRALLQEREAHAEARVRDEEWRQIGLGAQILKDLGITSIRLLASRERHYVGLEGFGIQITKTDII